MVQNMKEESKSYLIELEYGNRKKEKEFVKNILKRYGRESLVGVVLFVNNNPYHLELLLSLHFEKHHEDFDKYLAEKHPTAKRAYNRFVDDLMLSMQNKSYNVASVVDPEDVDIIMTSGTNSTFFFPDMDELLKVWGRPVTMNKPIVFLSHSSKDKELVDKVFYELQKSEVGAWYDKEEIMAGESITDKINDGLSKSDFGLIFLSESFLNGQSGWTIAEANFFMQQRMRDPSKKFIIVNIDVAHHDMPPLMQDYRYVDVTKTGFMDEIKRAINYNIKK